MKQWKKRFGIFMSVAVLMTGGILPKGNAATAEGVTDYGIGSPRIENGVTTWDKVKFGSYYQDAEVQPEPIKWRVLSVDENNNAFLLADSNLDCKPYHNVYEGEEENEGVTWETCTLRKWLNNDFYNEAFETQEKKAVIETEVANENNPSYDTEGGNDTKDKVYLLSIVEAGNAAYGFDTKFNTNSETRKSKTTDYAKVNNAWSNSNGFGYWWLRSPGDSSDDAAYVNYYGYGYDYGSIVEDSVLGVRPALHINLSSSKVTDAGEVDSEGNVTMRDNGINSPVVKDGVTTWDCVYFGNYRQNCTFKKQDIEWRVLSVDGDDAFLLADRNLDCKRYNEEKTDVTWETCTLRKWLNNDFYNEAFDAEEKKAVIETEVANENNPSYDTEGGNDTKDKVYLLSIAEAGNAEYGFDTKFNEDSKTREAKNTDYVKLNNAYSNSNGFGYWWLRSPGNSSIIAAYVNREGHGGYYGNDVGISRYGVRPALHINLSSSSWSKVGDDPTASPEPTKEPTPTEKPAASPEPTKEPTKEPTPTDEPILLTEPTQTPIPTAAAQPTPPAAATQKPASAEEPILKKLKLSSVKCAKNTKKITGKVSVSKATIKIKVGKKAYKKATVKGKKFTLKLNYKLKKKTKVIINAGKKGYKSLIKSYTVK